MSENSKNWQDLPVEMQAKVLEVTDFLTRKNFQKCSKSSSALVAHLDTHLELLKLEMLEEHQKLTVYETNSKFSMETRDISSSLGLNKHQIDTIFISNPQNYDVDGSLDLKNVEVQKIIFYGFSNKNYPRFDFKKGNNPKIMSRQWRTDYSRGPWENWRDMGGIKVYEVARCTKNTILHEFIAAKIELNVTSYLANIDAHRMSRADAYMVPEVHVNNPESTLQYLDGPFERHQNFCSKTIRHGKKRMYVKISKCGVFVGKFKDGEPILEENKCGMDFMCPNDCYGKSVENEMFRRIVSSLH